MLVRRIWVTWDLNVHLLKDLTDADAKESGDAEIPTVPLAPGEPQTAHCPICNEDFDTFFKQKLDGSDDDGCWHYVNAVKADDGRIFHPQCHKDLGAQSKSAMLLDSSQESVDESMEEGDGEGLKQEAKEEKDDEEKMDTNEALPKIDEEEKEVASEEPPGE